MGKEPLAIPSDVRAAARGIRVKEGGTAGGGVASDGIDSGINRWLRKFGRNQPSVPVGSGKEPTGTGDSRDGDRGKQPPVDQRPEAGGDSDRSETERIQDQEDQRPGQARAIEPESGSAEKKVDSRIIEAETEKEIELETAMAADSPDLIDRRTAFEDLLKRLPTLQQSYPGIWESGVFTELQRQSTHYVSGLEDALQSLAGRLMYTPRQINQILDRFGFSAERRQKLKDTIYENKRKYTINSDFHQDWKSDWRVERRIWVNDGDYVAWVSAREEAERRRMPAAIEGAFENGRLNTENLDGLIGFFDGISQAAREINQLPENERVALGYKIADLVEEIMDSDEPDDRRARSLANIIPLLSLEGINDATRNSLQIVGRLGLETTANPVINPAVSRQAYERIINAFENGVLNISNQDALIGFFDGIAQTGEAVNASPDQRNLLEGRILDEMEESFDIDPGRTRFLSNLAIFLGLDLTMSPQTRDAFYKIRHMQADLV